MVFGYYICVSANTKNDFFAFATPGNMLFAEDTGLQSVGFCEKTFWFANLFIFFGITKRFREFICIFAFINVTINHKNHDTNS